jgi:hypothetical protein
MKNNMYKSTPEECFFEMIKGLVDEKTEYYPDSIFYFKDKECFFELENSILWCNDFHVWNVLKDEYQMPYITISSFLKKMVGQYLGMKNVTPRNELYR